MTSRGYADATASDLTMAEFEAAARRLGRVVVTNGIDFDYAPPAAIPAGWRRFCMADRAGRMAEHARG